MKNKVLAVVALTALLFSIGSVINYAPLAKSKVAASNCQWKEVASYTGTDFSTSIAVDPTNPKTVYATIGNRLYKSTNCGAHWTPITGNVNSARIAVDYKNSNNVYLTDDKGFYRSTDGGAHWTKTFSKYLPNSPVAIDPEHPNIIYTGSSDGHIYKSANGGASFHDMKDIGKWVSTIAVSPVHTNVLYAGAHEGIFKSEDAGSSWTKITISSFWSVKEIVIDPENENRIYAIIFPDSSHSMLYVSNDAGTHWGTLGVTNPNSIAIDPKDSKNIYVASWLSGIYKSTDRGATWSKMNTGIPYTSAHTIVVDPVHPTILYCNVHEYGAYNTHIYRFSCPVALPTNFKAYFIGNSVAFSWKYPDESDIDYYKILYKQSGASSYKILEPKVSATKTFFYKSNFASTNTTFDFAIAAYRETEHSPWVHDTARHLMKPSVTSLVTFSNTQTSSTVKVSWNKTTIDPNADYISIQRNDPDCTGWLCFPIEVKKINKGTTDFNRGYTYVSGLKFGKEYTITVMPKDKDNGAGEDSNSDNATIFIPEIPTDLEAYSSGGSIHLIWKYQSAARSTIDRFEVYETAPQVKYFGVISRTFSSALLNFAGKPTGKYKFTVAAVKGNSRTYAAYDEAYLLKTPDKPALAISSGKVKITWDKNAIDSNANKVIILKSTNGTTYAKLGVVDKSIEEFTDSSVSTSTTYYYRLQIAREVTGKMPDASAVSVSASIETPAQQTAPAAPTNLTASAASCSEVALSWTDNSDNEEHFVVERKEENGSYSTLATLNPDTTEYTDSTVEGGKTYYYRVKATNGTGNSGYSNEVNVSVPECETVPSAPTNLSGTAVSSSEIDLTWSDNSDNEEGFKIERKEEGGSYSEVASLPSDTTTYKDTGLSADTTYYYRIKAFNNKGESNHSNEISIKTESAPDTTPPLLTITSPTNFETVNEDTVTVKGKATDNESGIDTVTVNDSAVTVQSEGTFSIDVSLSEGDNTIKVIATDKAGNKTTKAVIVKYEKNNPPPEKEKIVITLQPDNPIMTVNGVMKEIDPGRGTKPVIIPKWSRTVVPIRAIVESLGGTIEWDGTERKVTIHFNGTTINLWIDNPRAKVNGTAKWIDDNNHDVKPIIVNSRTMLPLRFVAENLGCTVEWDASTRTITIIYVKP